MLSVLRGSVAGVVLLLAAGYSAPLQAQTAGDVSVRMSQLEEEVRQLTGQVEQLSNQVRQLKAQVAANGAATAPGAPAPAPFKLKKTGAAQPAAVPAVADAGNADQPDAGQTADQGTEQIQDNGASATPASSQAIIRTVTNADGSESQVEVHQAPGPKVLGSMGASAAQPGDGGFQGQVLVAPAQQDAGADAAVMQQQANAATASGMAGSSDGSGDGVQPASLSADTPESLYERSNESLLKRQFGDAEAGFSAFLQKYPDHALAGSAAYWLGETYYAENDYRQAAQAFLQGYRKYPDGRRAADSLLKLGISLGRLGQQQQACAAFASVDQQYPKAVETRRRAQAESKRAGCPS